MKKFIAALCLIGLVFPIAACGKFWDKKSTKKSEISSTGEKSLPESIESEDTYASPYKTREISRNGNYKTMEMYVYKDQKPYAGRITFEVPIGWDGTSSVIGSMNENDKNIVKVDMLHVQSGTREDALNSYNGPDPEGEVGRIGEAIYSTENYEVFFAKKGPIEASICSYYYYLYADGEYFSLCGWVFIKDKPEYDAVFKRIAESVRFQP